MTKYYCIVFLDRRKQVLEGSIRKLAQHGHICHAGLTYHVYTSYEEAEAEYNKTWRDRSGGYWEDCYVIWEFEV